MLTDQVAVVTGAGRGIGRAIAQSLGGRPSGPLAALLKAAERPAPPE